MHLRVARVKAGLEAVVSGRDLKSILRKGMMSWGPNRVEILWTGLCTLNCVWPCWGGKQAVALFEGSTEYRRASGVWDHCINILQATSANTEKTV